MSTSPWKSTAVWIGAITLILAGIRSVYAEDVGAPANVLRAPDEKTKDLARLVWSIIDVVERQHIDPPSRDKMLRGIASALGHKQNTKSGDLSTAKLRDCRTFDEFSDLFLRDWNESIWTHNDCDRFLALVFQRIFKDAPNSIRLVKTKDYAVEEQFRNNRYVGLGVNINISRDEQLPQFMRIMPGGAAERAGLETGVTVLAVDGHETKGIEISTIIDWIRGPKGTPVTLKLAPHGQQPQRELTLTRGVVRVDSVFGLNQSPVSRGEFRFASNEVVGCLLIGSITSSTLQELRDAEVRIRADGIRALILDFGFTTHSDNFHQARLLADGLMDGGTIWSWHERTAEPRLEFADRECLFRGMPFVILVSQRTGPAHAALAAALQDCGRAVIVGDQPDFKGIVSSGVPLFDEQHVLIMDTTKLIRSRSDRNWPLKPDHLVTQPPSEPVPMIARQQTPNGRVTIPLSSSGRVMDVPTVPRVLSGRTVTPQGRSSSAGVPTNQSERPDDSQPLRGVLAEVVESFYNRHGIDSGQSGVSALFPANYSNVEIMAQLREIMRLRNAPAPNNLSVSGDTAQPFAGQFQQARTTATNLARKIAVELSNEQQK